MERNVKVPTKEPNNCSMRDKAIQAILEHRDEMQKLLDQEAESLQKDAERELRELFLAGMSPQSRMYDICSYLEAEVVWEVEGSELRPRMGKEALRVARAAHKAGMFRKVEEINNPGQKDVVIEVGALCFSDENFYTLSTQTMNKTVKFKEARKARREAERYRESQTVDQLNEPALKEPEVEDLEESESEIPF